MKLVNKNNVDNQVEESNLVQLYHKTAAAAVLYSLKVKHLTFMGY